MKDLRIDPQVEPGEELIKRHDLPGTPFTMIEADNQVFGVMGKYRITLPRKATEENRSILHSELKEITWNRIIQIMAILINQSEEIKNFVKDEN